MPYIDQKARDKYEPTFGDLRERIEIEGEELTETFGPITIPKGELTYLVYSLGYSYFRGRESYETISQAISSLTDAAEELRRRYLNPHEDKAIERNGDVE